MADFEGPMNRRGALGRFLTIPSLIAGLANSQHCHADDLKSSSDSPAEKNSWPFQCTDECFVLYANHEIRNSQLYLSELKQLKADLSEVLELPCDRGEYHLVLFDCETSFREYIQHYFPRVPLRRALFIKHRGPGLIFTYLHDDLLIDLRHEGTHALLNEACGPLPLWLDEGLAEYFEVAREQRFAGCPHLKETRWRVRLGQVPNLERLESAQDMADMDANDYRDAWAWVHFLLHRTSESRHALNQHLIQISQLNAEIRLSRQLKNLFADFRSEFVAHFKSYPVGS